MVAFKISQSFRTVVLNGHTYLHHLDVEMLLQKAREVQTDLEVIANFNALQVLVSDAARSVVNPLGLDRNEIHDVLKKKRRR